MEQNSSRSHSCPNSYSGSLLWSNVSNFLGNSINKWKDLSDFLRNSANKWKDLANFVGNLAKIKWKEKSERFFPFDLSRFPMELWENGLGC